MPQLINHDSAARATMSFHDTLNWTFDLEVFKSEMRSFGIVDSWDMDLLEARYYRGMSYRQIEEDQNFVSYKKVERRLRQLHSLLKERGYKRKKPK